MSLVSILNEVFIGRPVLYHFTTSTAITDIIDQNKLKVINYDYVSFSRNYNAEIFAYDNRDCRLTFDWNRLKDFYKIETFRYNGEIIKKFPKDLDDKQKNWMQNHMRKHVDKEAEERVNGDVTNIRRFIIQIDFLFNDALTKMPFYQQLLDKTYLKDDYLYKDVPVNLVNKWEPVKV